MEYDVIVTSNIIAEVAAKELTQNVARYIQDNWKPIGGVSQSIDITKKYTMYVMAQAMIKE